MEKIIFIGGVYNLIFALFHLFFWKLFHWQDELKSISFINRQIMQILNLCLTFVFFAIAYISFFHTNELLQEGLGHSLLIIFALFWFLRSIEQIIFFGIKTKLSVAFTIIFFSGSLIYLIPLVGRL